MMRAALRFAIVVLAAIVPLRYSSAEVGDIAFVRKAAGTEDVPPAIFPHFVHRMQFKCHVCHDAIIVMKAGANPITMDAIQDGKYCGVCHNGKTAFQATFEACPRCHRP
ncbi:MAG: cytochrome c3 family protein [Betaproteobacteria bacterium]|nr:cytochrome c3 family protein [Betaproteobacteria bacterium]